MINYCLFVELMTTAHYYIVTVNNMCVFFVHSAIIQQLLLSNTYLASYFDDHLPCKLYYIMKQRWRRWSTYFTMACFFLAGGVEYSVIFPTMYDYVTSKGGQGWLYGLSLSAFSLSNLVTAPLYGLVFDKTKKTKFIVLFANIFEICGKLPARLLLFCTTSQLTINYITTGP